MRRPRDRSAEGVLQLSRRGFLSLMPPLVLAGCQALPGLDFPPRQSDSVRRLVLLYTNDEHGWMEPTEDTGGAAGLLDRWQRGRGLGREDERLILSGGDMWTGPAISTSLAGASMTDVMNRMGYAAAALGNHDFDFGVEVLEQRARQANFPFLSANLRDRQSGEIPEFARAYSLHHVNGVHVAVIGLTTTETQVDTRPSYVQGFSFRDYESALAEVLPQVRAENPDLILVVGHLCHGPLRQLVDTAEEQRIPVLTGGHCHEEHNVDVDGVRLVESGYFLRGYITVEMYIDTERDEILWLKSYLHSNPPGPQVPELADQIADWKRRTNPKLWQVIGYTRAEINRRSRLMDRLIADAWLRALPSAQVALASRRYVQQSIPGGEITPATIVGVLPVENVLMQIQLRGEDLERTIRERDPVMAGVQMEGDGLRLEAGTPLDPQAIYQVIVPDVIYYGANYYELQQLDPDPLDTGISWRDPVLDYLEALESSTERPLDELLQE